MADDNSDSEGVGSEDIDAGEILEQLEAMESGKDKKDVECDMHSGLYLKKKKKGLKKGKKWKFYKCYLSGSSLWYYRPQEDSPKSCIELKKFELGAKELTAAETRPNTFSMNKADLSTVWIFSATSADLRTQWIKALTDIKDKPSAKPPIGQVKRKSSLIMRAKKKVAGKAATSGVGKRLIKSVMRDDEIDQLFVRGKAIVARDKDAKFADNLEDTIIKIAVKGILLMRNGDMDQELARPLEPCLRKLGKDMKETWNDKIRFKRDPEKMKEAAAANYKKISDGVREVEKLLNELMSPYVTESTTDKIKHVCDYLGEADTWKRVYEDPEQQDDLQYVLERVAYYLRFY